MNWIVVTDFDGTITEKDIGNELCKLYRPQLYSELSAAYSKELLKLRDFQHQIWTGFPCKKEEFISSSLRVATLRPGVNEFFEMCAHKNIPVYIASCGMDVYIDSIIDRFFSKFAQAAIKGIACNKTTFDDRELVKIEPPDNEPAQPEPLHKGRWAKALANESQAKVIAIGNGGSDRTFIGHVDTIFATEKLINICEAAGESFIPFNHFFDILKKWPLK